MQSLKSNNPMQIYKTNQMTTATPAELTLMLYEGAIKFIKRSKLAIENRQIEQAHQNIQRVQDILTELIVSLNRDIPISNDFLKMYEYMQTRLLEANIQKSIEILDEVEDFFVQFRDTWKQVMELTRKSG